MILGVGTDLVHIKRIEATLEEFGDRFVKRILSWEEQDFIAEYEDDKAKVAFLAKRFAAKEAIAKALGVGIGEQFSFQDATIYKTPKGQPKVSLSKKATDLFASLTDSDSKPNIHISISDERKYAIAYVMIEAV